MLHNLIAIKLAAMASALGLNTEEWTNPSKDMVKQVQVLEDSIKVLNDVDTKDHKGATPEKRLEAQKSSQTALDEIKSLANKGDKDALFAMGLLTQRSNQQGALADVLDYYARAAAQNQLQALNNHGFLLAATSQDPEKQKQGVNEIKDAADKGLGAAKRNRAQLLLRGVGGDGKDPSKNIDEALKLLEASAKSDKDGEAEWMLSQFYFNGGEKYGNADTGLKYLNAAADKGNPNALDTLGNFYSQGIKKNDKDQTVLVKADPEEAIKKFKKLADAGNPVGLRKMAQLLQNGVPTVDKDGKPTKEFLLKPDIDKSLEDFAKAAQSGDAVAQYQLGTMFETGIAVPQKDDKGEIKKDKDGKIMAEVKVQPNPNYALAFYKQAVQNNVPAAAFKVAQYYEQGVAVDRDLQKAFVLYMAAAQAGVPDAYQKVANFYANGASVTKDPLAASVWYQRSAAAGNIESAIAYGVLVESGAVLVPNPGATAEQIYRDAYHVIQFQRDNAKMQLTADALKNFETQANALTVAACLRLASLHERGITSNPARPDPAKALAWLKLAKRASEDKNEQIVKAHDAMAAAAKAEDKDTAVKLVDRINAETEDYIKEQRDRAKKAATGTAAPETSAPSVPTARAADDTSKGKGKGKGTK